MAIKLVAIDIDGTLVDDHKRISAKTKDAIKRAKQKGVYIVLCTGRPVSGIQDYLNELDLLSSNDYAITYNGAQGENIGQKKIVFTNLLNQSDYQELLEISKQAHVRTQIVTADSKLYTTDANISPYTVLDAFYTKMPLYYCQSSDLPCMQAAKFMLVDEPQVIDAALKYFDSSVCQKYYTVRSEAWFFEFMHKKANKGQAVLELAQKLGIKASEVLALGDQNNDLTMIKLAGLGIAMGNANETVKKAADAITSDNNHDGVAVALEKYVLN